MLALMSMNTGALTRWREPSHRNGLMLSSRRRNAARAGPGPPGVAAERHPTRARFGRSRHARAIHHETRKKHTVDVRATAASEFQKTERPKMPRLWPAWLSVLRAQKLASKS